MKVRWALAFGAATTESRIRKEKRTEGKIEKERTSFPDRLRRYTDARRFVLRIEILGSFYLSSLRSFNASLIPQFVSAGDRPRDSWIGLRISAD